MVATRKLLQQLLARAGWALHRWPPNRFDAMADALLLLSQRGYRPGVIIDVGANVGHWSDVAAPIFNAPRHHLVEPVPACQPALARFTAPRFQVHAVALSSPGVSSISMVSDDSAATNTGAHVVAGESGDAGAIRIPATTLDALLANEIGAHDHALLKLDVESHELPVLRGGDRVLQMCDVVIVEFQLFQFDSTPVPLLADTVAFLRQRGFELYDIATLSGRPRDRRLRSGDAVFVRINSPLMVDSSWA